MPRNKYGLFTSSRCELELPWRSYPNLIRARTCQKKGNALHTSNALQCNPKFKPNPIYVRIVQTLQTIRKMPNIS